MSSVRKAKNGYYGIVNYYDKDKKRHQKSTGFFKLKRDALKEANKLEQELNTINVNLKDVSLVDYYQQWNETYKQASSLSYITKNRYSTFAKSIAKYFKDMRLRDVKRSTYQGFINWYGHSHGYSSISKLNSAIRQCIGYAIDDDVIQKDFTHNVQLNYNKSHHRKNEYLNMKELEQLLKALKEGLNRHNTSRYMILTSIYTGMRKSEIQALTWNDIDELHGTITISKTWDDNKKAFKPTKTKTSTRIIPVNRELLKILDDLKANNSTMIFKNALGTIPTSNALKKCLNSILNDCGIKKQGFHFHSLRHVHVAFLLSKGIPIDVISKRLGHSKTSVTLNVYAYLIDEFKAQNDKLIIQKLSEL